MRTRRGQEAETTHTHTQTPQRANSTAHQNTSGVATVHVLCSGFTVGLFAYYERHDVDAGEGRRGRSICRLPQSHRCPRARALDPLARSVHSLCSARRNGPRMFRRCTLLCTPSTRSQRVAAVAPTCSPSKDRARCHGASRDIMCTRAPCLSRCSLSPLLSLRMAVIPFGETARDDKKEREPSVGNEDRRTPHLVDFNKTTLAMPVPAVAFTRARKADAQVLDVKEGIVGLHEDVTEDPVRRARGHLRSLRGTRATTPA